MIVVLDWVVIQDSNLACLCTASGALIVCIHTSIHMPVCL